MRERRGCCREGLVPRRMMSFFHELDGITRVASMTVHRLRAILIFGIRRVAMWGPARGRHRDVLRKPGANRDGTAIGFPPLEHVEMSRFRDPVSVALVENCGNHLRRALNFKHLELVAKGFCDRFIVQIFPALAIGVVQNNTLVAFGKGIQKTGKAFCMRSTDKTLVKFVGAILLDKVVVDRADSHGISRTGSEFFCNQTSEIGLSRSRKATNNKNSFLRRGFDSTRHILFER